MASVDRRAPAVVIDLLDDYSLEMTTKDVGRLEEVALKATSGIRISVTFLPNEEFSARIAAAAAVRRHGFVPVPHISARRVRSASELKDFLQRLRSEADVDQILVIAGDLDTPAGPYEDALAIIRTGYIADCGIKHVAVSGHPLGHPAIDNERLSRAMHDKIKELRAQGLDVSITTQFSFEADRVLDWLRRIRQEGVRASVRIGVPGPASVKTLLQFAARCGVEASTKVLAKYGVSITQLLSRAGPNSFVNELAAGLEPSLHGPVGIQFYPFGGLLRTIEWVDQFKSGLTPHSGVEAGLPINASNRSHARSP